MLTSLVFCFCVLNLRNAYGFGEGAEYDLKRYDGYMSNLEWQYGDEILEQYHNLRKRSADNETVTEGKESTSIAPKTTSSSNVNGTSTSESPPKTTQIPTTAKPEKLNSTTEGAATEVVSSSTSTKLPGNVTEEHIPATTKGVVSSSTTTTTTETPTDVPSEAPKENELDVKHTDKNETVQESIQEKTPKPSNPTTPTQTSSQKPEIQPKTLPDDKVGRKALEHLNHHQSNNAILTAENKGISETEEELGRMATKEHIKSAVDPSQPKEGASSATSSASKSNDTLILVLLFAAVVVVGLAAVGYNYARKKRRGRTSNARTGENGDVETGREMKPLMKRDQEKDAVKGEEITTDVEGK